MTEKVKTGTTTLGMVCSDGIIIAADKRATVGNMIARGKIDKVLPINERMAITIAGTVSDAVLLVKLIKAETRINKLKLGRHNTVKEAANLIGSLVYNNIRRMSVIAGVTHFIFAGMNDNGSFELYDIFPDGTVTRIDSFISSGSGSSYALGILQGYYKENMSITEGVGVAKRAFDAALRNDSASGNGVDLYKLTTKGVEHIETIMLNTGLF
ncbi:MAG: proteasome beta subunit [Candidatus Woesearchaeota archaeon]|jgi:proteasome beta subunit